MFSYRVTKYNPCYRNDKGFYVLKDEWHLYAQLGDIFEGKVFTYEDYLTVEDAYVEAILCFMDCLNLESLSVTSLEKNGLREISKLVKSKAKKNTFYTTKVLEIANNLHNGMVAADLETIAIITRLVLRENCWLKFEANGMYVHFGCDYYMYIGIKKLCEAAIKQITTLGLFVEPCRSPYYPESNK